LIYFIFFTIIELFDFDYFDSIYDYIYTTNYSIPPSGSSSDVVSNPPSEVGSSQSTDTDVEPAPFGNYMWDIDSRMQSMIAYRRQTLYRLERDCFACRVAYGAISGANVLRGIAHT
jgi:hypothetical protein